MRCRAVAASFFACAIFSTLAARADDESPRKWVDRPMILAAWQASFGAGVASARLPTTDGVRSGTGASFEAVIGLPVLLELGVRTGVRANDVAKIAGADRFARTFDHETSNLGADEFANPEIRLRGSLADFEGVVALGVETRFIVPRARDTHFTVAPGLPLRIYLDHVARIDTGVFVPFRFDADTQFTISVPVDLYFQVGDFFFGPSSGLRFHRIDATSPKTNRVDVPLGLSLGWTFFHRLDLGAQIHSFRMNDEEWKHTFGVGLGAQVTVP